MDALAVKRSRALAREHAPEVLIYCAVRAVGLIVLAAMAGHVGRLPSLLTKWDGKWYLDVARHGYDTALAYRPGGGLINTNIVFFPLYPLLIAAFGLVLGAAPAALLISLLSGIAAAVALRTVGQELYDRRTGLLLVALWAAVPTAVVESMAYTESLYTALAAFTVLFLIRRRWLAAGVASLLAGLTHPTGVAAAAAVGVCALATVARRESGWKPWLAAALAPVGALGYLAWVAVALGRWDGFSFMEAQGWRSKPSLIGVWHQITADLTQPQQLGNRVPVYVLFATVALAAVLTAMLLRSRVPGGLPVAAFAWASIALGLFIGPAYFHAESRFLMPDFPVLLPPAVLLARRNVAVSVAVVAACALLSAWYGGYLLTVWTHSP
ncbi:hypothetical protein [Actinospica robiniae]|uniref:hypothetical protein n=1 Tax=Actinospica robiniae TaxID=304901 RepID=UPI000429702A|nr:hypothetical protein [Actinospica robiniae]